MNFQSVTVKNPVGAKAGDCVVIEMDSNKVLFSAFLVYILPILVFVIAYYGMQKLDFSATLSGGTAAVLTVLFFGVTMLFDRRHKSDFLPKIVKIEENA